MKKCTRPYRIDQAHIRGSSRKTTNCGNIWTKKKKRSKHRKRGKRSKSTTTKYYQIWYSLLHHTRRGFAAGMLWESGPQQKHGQVHYNSFVTASRRHSCGQDYSGTAQEQKEQGKVKMTRCSRRLCCICNRKVILFQYVQSEEDLAKSRNQVLDDTMMFWWTKKLTTSDSGAAHAQDLKKHVAKRLSSRLGLARVTESWQKTIRCRHEKSWLTARTVASRNAKTNSGCTITLRSNVAERLKSRLSISQITDVVRDCSWE